MLGILLVGGLFSIGHSVDNSKCEYVAMVNLKNVLEEYIYFNDDNYKVVYDSLSNEVTHVAYEPNQEIDTSKRNDNDGYNLDVKDGEVVSKKNEIKDIESKDIIKISSIEDDVSVIKGNENNKIKETPAYKREKLKNSVFASDEEKRTVRNRRVELNNDNLGYLADY